MGYLDLPFFFVKSPDMLQLLQQVQHAVNYMDESNFPNKVSGGSILAGDHSVPLSSLNWLEWPIPLTLPGTAVSTTTTIDCGGFWVFDPTKYPGGTWYFEAALNTSVAASSVTAQLKNGATVIGSVASGTAAWTVVRSAALTMPTAAAALTVTLVSPATTTTAYLWAARMIFTP